MVAYPRRSGWHGVGAMIVAASLLGGCGRHQANPTGTVLVSMADNSYSPAIVRVPVGGSIVFINAGRNDHNAVAVDKILVHRKDLRQPPPEAGRDDRGGGISDPGRLSLLLHLSRNTRRKGRHGGRGRRRQYRLHAAGGRTRRACAGRSAERHDGACPRNTRRFRMPSMQPRRGATSSSSIAACIRRPFSSRRRASRFAASIETRRSSRKFELGHVGLMAGADGIGYRENSDGAQLHLERLLLDRNPRISRRGSHRL